MKYLIIILVSATLLLVYSCSKSNNTTNPTVDDSKQLALLNTVKINIDSTVTFMYSQLKNAVVQLTFTDSDSNVTTYLNDWINHIKNLEETAYISKMGIFKYIEPIFYQTYQGTDISTQPLFSSIAATKLPGMSNYFQSAEGYYAIDLEYPRINNFGDFTGVFSMKFKPTTLLGTIIENIIKQEADDFMLIQTDGTVFYDGDNSTLNFLGKNLLTDASFKTYTDFQTAVTNITTAATGKTTFHYLDKTGKTLVNKTVWWTTLSYYGVSWKLCLVKEG